MRRRFQLALLAIPAGTLLTHAVVGTWQASNLAKLRDRVQTALSDTLTLENELGYGGLIHNFKNALLRRDEPEFLSAARENAEAAITLIDGLEALARSDGVDFELNATREMVNSYAAALDTIANNPNLSVAQLDQRVQIDDEPALLEIKEFQTALINEVRGSIEFIETVLLVIGVLISMMALAGGYYVFLLAQSEQQRELERRRMTDQKLLDQVNLHNADLQRVNTSLQQFAGLAAHDLATPSRQIISFSELAEDKATSDEQRQFYLGAIRKSAEKMRQLVETLLEFARQGFRSPKREMINSASLLRDVVNELSRNHQRPFNIRIGELPHINADPVLLERVFTNLLENSIKYAKPDVQPEIEVEGWRAQGRSFIRVTDNGIGIDPAYSEIIFEPFRRIKADHEAGTGIGLSLVKSIIESHGGRIRLDSSYKNGTRFIIWLPERISAATDEAA